MDSPSLQSAAHLPSSRVRAYTTLSAHSSADHRGAIHKRANSRSRAISASQSDRLYRLAAEQQANQAEAAFNNNSLQFLTPQQSPVPSNLSVESSIDQFPAWNIPPTPPRSDCGIQPVSLDLNEDSVSTTLSAPQDFSSFDHPTASADMSSLGFLLPSQYGGTGFYETEPTSYGMDQNYMPPMRMSQSGATSGVAAYAQTVTSSPAMYQSSARRPGDMSNQSPAHSQSYDSNTSRMSNNPYDSPAGNMSMAPSQSIPSISGLGQPTLPSPPMSSSGTPMMPPYNTSMPRSPNLYDQNMYSQAFTTAPGATQIYAPTHSMSYPPPFVGSSVNEVLSKPMGSDSSIRVLNQRPKPQCWEHGCNGRQFSTFSNLLRHQREKSGTASKSYCPKCGAEFTRTTARNGHLAHDKCTKQRRPSDAK